MIIFLVLMTGLLVGIFFCLIEIVGAIEKIRAFLDVTEYGDFSDTLDDHIEPFEVTCIDSEGHKWVYKDGKLTEVKE